MNKIKNALVVAALITCAMPAMAQEKHVSPHETISAVIDGNRVTITYGRPYMVKPGTTEVRKIWGGLVPYDKPWRMGADEATLLVTQKPIAIGGKTVPAGAYTLYMVPSETGASQQMASETPGSHIYTPPGETGASQLIFSTGLGGWGVPVDTKHDLAQAELTKAALDKPVDQFTMGVEKNPAGGGVLKLSWESAQFSVPFTVQK